MVLCSWSLCARRRCCECGQVWYSLWAETCCQPTPRGSSAILSVSGSWQVEQRLHVEVRDVFSRDESESSIHL